MNDMNFLFGNNKIDNVIMTSLDERIGEREAKINGSNKSKASLSILGKLKRFYYLNLYKFVQKGSVVDYKEAVDSKIAEMEEQREARYKNYEDVAMKLAEDSNLGAATAIDDTFLNREKRYASDAEEIEKYKAETSEFAKRMEAKNREIKNDVEETKNITSRLMSEVKQQEENKKVNEIQGDSTEYVTNDDSDKEADKVINQTAAVMAEEVNKMSEQEETKENNVDTPIVENTSDGPIAENNEAVQEEIKENETTVVEVELPKENTNAPIIEYSEVVKEEPIQENSTVISSAEIMNQLKSNIDGGLAQYVDALLKEWEKATEIKMQQIVEKVITEKDAIIKQEMEKNKQLEATIKEMEQSKNKESNTLDNNSYQQLEAKLNILTVQSKDKDDIIAAKDKELAEKDKIILAYQLKEQQMIQPEVNLEEPIKTR